MWKYRFLCRLGRLGEKKSDWTYPDITSGSRSRTQLAKVSSSTGLHQMQPWGAVLEAGLKGEQGVESVWARGSRNIFLQLVRSGTSPGMCHQQPHRMSTENCQAQFFDLHFSCYLITYNPSQENHIKTEQHKKKPKPQTNTSPTSAS